MPGVSAPRPAVAARPAMLALAGLVLGLAGAALALVPAWLRRAILTGIVAVVAAGLFRDVFASILANFVPTKTQRLVFAASGVKLLPAVVIFAVAAGLSAWRSLRPEAAVAAHAGRARRIGLVVMLAALIVLPLITNDFIGQVMILVALYIVMSTGLHVELGLAGLVDLGFVAFYAVGAYTVALLCSQSPIAIADLSFWVALPIAILAAAGAGLLFGLPVSACAATISRWRRSGSARSSACWWSPRCLPRCSAERKASSPSSVPRSAPTSSTPR